MKLAVIQSIKSDLRLLLVKHITAFSRNVVSEVFISN
jgi:hypothetical protein